MKVLGSHASLANQLRIPHLLGCPWKLVTIFSKLGYFTYLEDVSNLLILGLYIVTKYNGHPSRDSIGILAFDHQLTPSYRDCWTKACESFGGASKWSPGIFMYFPILNEELFGTPESSKSPGRKMRAAGPTGWKFWSLVFSFWSWWKEMGTESIGWPFFGGGGGLIEIRGIPKEKRMYLENYWWYLK